MTEKTMQERIARALCRRVAADTQIAPDQVVLNLDNKRVPYWTLWTPDADAVLAEMQVPTGGDLPLSMLVAGKNALFRCCESPEIEDARTVWRAMVAEARKP